MCVLSHVRLFVIPWTVACQALLSLQARILGWVAIPTPGDLPDHGIICSSPASPQAYSLPLRHLGKPLIYFIHIYLCVCLCIYIYACIYTCMLVWYFLKSIILSDIHNAWKTIKASWFYRWEAKWFAQNQGVIRKEYKFIPLFYDSEYYCLSTACQLVSLASYSSHTLFVLYS